MLQRLYVHNFRCLENFELILKDLPSVLLIGKNGVGKSTISKVLEIFQDISRGTNRVRELVKKEDFSYKRTNIPMRFELEVLINQELYKYFLVLELPEGFKELRVAEEILSVRETNVYSRSEAQVSIDGRNAQFSVDWHLVALPLIQAKSTTDPLHIFKNWLAQMIILSPVPSLMSGESNQETLESKRDGSNFADWFSGLLNQKPAAYSIIETYLRGVMPDISDIQNSVVSSDSKKMEINFEVGQKRFSVDFENLSDGEKCFFICAVILASNKYYETFCFWDEPDNYIAISEVDHFIMKLRQAFNNKGQILVTSHNYEAIRKFSSENTFVLDRKSHLEPTLIRLLENIDITGDLRTALLCGDIEL